MLTQVTIAGVQMDTRIGARKDNLEKIIDFARKAARHGARIVVYPECCLTGYIFADLQEARLYAEPVPGASTKALHRICKELDIMLLVGMLEAENDKIYNAAVLIGSEGVIGIYRKIHLPLLGLDGFVNGGNIPFTVYPTKFGKLGWVICYDGSFCESVRILALQGAEIVALLVNWPEGDELIPKYMVPARAIENRINYIAVNRVGIERGVRFIGQSKIVDISGNTLSRAGSSREEIIFAKVNLSKAREKRTVIVPGKFEYNRLEDRRPEFYKPILEKYAE
jgi:predicted amidohydrolase